MITVKNIPQRREAVTAINVYDRENGLNSSQRAKYERPLWAFVAALLPGEDRTYAPSQTDLQEQLAEHGIHVTLPAIGRTLHIMLHLDESIHPHRRNCGVSCYEAVKQMGGIQMYPDNHKDNVTRYSFGASHAKVTYLRRVFGLTIQVKP